MHIWLAREGDITYLHAAPEQLKRSTGSFCVDQLLTIEWRLGAVSSRTGYLPSAFSFAAAAGVPAAMPPPLDVEEAMAARGVARGVEPLAVASLFFSVLGSASAGF